MLTFAIRATATLLGIGALLVIVGAFDSSLGWDIFSPTLEKVLYGVFFSSLALAAAGVALCFILGIHELTELMRAAQEGREPPLRQSTRRSVRLAAAAIALVALLVGTLEIVDRRVQVHRHGEFQRLAQEQMAHFGPKLLPELPDSPSPTASPKLALLIDTLDNLDFVRDATLFLADPTDPDVLWRYKPGWPPQNPPTFARIFVMGSEQRAVRRALDGDRAALDAVNTDRGFLWLAPVAGNAGPRAVVSISADESQNFRTFLGS